MSTSVYRRATHEKYRFPCRNEQWRVGCCCILPPIVQFAGDIPSGRVTSPEPSKICCCKCRDFPAVCLLLVSEDRELSAGGRRAKSPSRIGMRETFSIRSNQRHVSMHADPLITLSCQASSPDASLFASVRDHCRRPTEKRWEKRWPGEVPGCQSESAINRHALSAAGSVPILLILR
jgi:hypothetical protein